MEVNNIFTMIVLMNKQPFSASIEEYTNDTINEGITQTMCQSIKIREHQTTKEIRFVNISMMSRRSHPYPLACTINEGYIEGRKNLMKYQMKCLRIIQSIPTPWRICPSP